MKKIYTQTHLVKFQNAKDKKKILSYCQRAGMKMENQITEILAAMLSVRRLSSIFTI